MVLGSLQSIGLPDEDELVEEAPALEVETFPVVDALVEDALALLETPPVPLVELAEVVELVDDVDEDEGPLVGPPDVEELDAPPLPLGPAPGTPMRSSVQEARIIATASAASRRESIPKA